MALDDKQLYLTFSLSKNTLSIHIIFDVHISCSLSSNITIRLPTNDLSSLVKKKAPLLYSDNSHLLVNSMAPLLSICANFNSNFSSTMSLPYTQIIY